MKKARSDALRPEYKRSDFPRLERGKYAKRIKSRSNIVVLEPNVAAVFPNSAAVNEALQSLVDVAQRIKRPSPAPSRSSRPKRAG